MERPAKRIKGRADVGTRLGDIIFIGKTLPRDSTQWDSGTQARGEKRKYCLGNTVRACSVVV